MDIYQIMCIITGILTAFFQTTKEEDYGNNFNITILNEKKMGLLFENIGKLKLSISNWKLFILVDLHDFFEQERVLLNYEKTIRGVCQQSQQNFSIHHTCVDTLTVARKIMVRIASTNEIIKTYMGINPYNRKSKRGLINAVGTASKYLFGTLDENDEEVLLKHIQNVRDDENKVKHLLLNQTSIIKSALKDMQNQNTLFHSDLILFKRRITELDEKLRQNNRLVNSVNQYFNDLRLFVLFESLANEYQTMQDHFLQGIKFSKEGKLHPYLINTTLLLDELKNINMHLSITRQRLPMDVNFENISQFYELLHITYCFFKNTLTLKIEIPLTLNDIFNIYLSYPIPLNSRNNTFEFIEIKNNIVVINSLKETYFTLSEKDFYNKLQRLNNDTVMLRQNPILFKVQTSKDCEVLYLVKTPKSYPETCSIRILKLTNPLFINLANKISWLFWAPKATFCEILCDNSVIKTFQISGVGIITLYSNCRLRTDSIILESPKIYSTKTHLQLLTTENNISSFISIKTWKALDTKNVNYIDSKEPSQFLQKESMDLDNLLEEENNLMNGENQTFTYNVTNISLFSVIFIVLALIVIVVIGKTTKRKLKSHLKRSKNQEVNIELDEMPRKPEPVPRKSYKSSIESKLSLSNISLSDTE